MQRALVLAFLAALLASVAPALAQAPTPAASLELAVPPGPVTIALGSTHAVPIEVTLQLENFACPQPSNVTVEFAVRDLPSPLAGVRATAAAATFDVPAAAYTSASPYRQTAQATLDIAVAAEALPAHAHEFEVTARYAGGSVAGCVATGSFPAAEGTGTHRIMTGGAAPSTPAAGAGGPGTAPPPPGAAPSGAAQRSTPGAGALLVLAAVGVALALRR